MKLLENRNSYYFFLVFQPNHLVGLKRTFLKLSFAHVDDLTNVRQTILRAVNRNKERSKGQTVYTNMLSRYGGYVYL